MKRKYVCGILTAIVCNCALVLGTPVMCYATMPECYDFEKAWDGNGSVEIVLDWATPEELLEVSLGDVTLGEGDYTVKPFNDGLKLEITEAGLKKLPLENGSNFLWAKFAGRRDTLEVHEYVTLEEGDTEVSFAKRGATELLRIVNKSSEDLLSVVYDTEYTIEENDTEFTVKFSEDFLKNLYKREFWVYCLKDKYVNLQLIKSKLWDVNYDGKVDLNDVKIVLKTSLGIRKDSTEIKMTADYDKDDKITLNDAKNCLRASIGLKV